MAWGRARIRSRCAHKEGGRGKGGVVGTGLLILVTAHLLPPQVVKKNSEMMFVRGDGVILVSVSAVIQRTRMHAKYAFLPLTGLPTFASVNSNVPSITPFELSQVC